LRHLQSAVPLIESNEPGISMLEGGNFGSDDEDAAPNLALPRGSEQKEERKKYYIISATK